MHLAIGAFVFYTVGNMHTEFEATFTSVNLDEVRNTLTDAGATLMHPEFLMRRKIFIPVASNDIGYLRVRQEATKVTMAYKHNNGTEISDQKEVELTIDSFEEGVLFCESIGARQKAYQETKREVLELNAAEIAIDTWPGLNPFVEIEAKNESVVRQVAAELGFEYAEALFGAVHKVYEKELGIPPDVINNETPLITFEHPPKLYD